MHTIISEQFRKTILRDALKIFKAEGVHTPTEEEVVKMLGISSTTLSEIASGKEDLFRKAVLNDMQDSRAKQNEIISRYSNSVDQLMNLLKLSLDDSKGLSPKYISDYMTFPELWAEVEREIEEFSIPLYHRILNNGIREGVFRKDINIDIVTKVIMQNLYVLLNFKVFPPERYNTGEILRSIYLYYFRGLCETESAKLVDKHFT